MPGLPREFESEKSITKKSLLAPRLDEPVFILTCGRSGSTLLRKILDSHEDLACPAETNIPDVCSDLWDAWAFLDPASGMRSLSEKARSSIRAAVGAIYHEFLVSQNKSRWCNKSLGTAACARKLVDIYSDAKFICLYRHGMDVINSALEATPFGMLGYGLEQIGTSANSVTALADFWLEHTTQILEFEKSYPEKCIRVHYEQLALEPDLIADEVYRFIGVASSPGAVARALSNQANDGKHDVGDYKIRATSRISGSSIGRGLRVPTGLLYPNQKNAMNKIFDELGYTKIDREWDLATVPPALLSMERAGSSLTGTSEVVKESDSSAETPGLAPSGDSEDDQAEVAKFEDLDNKLTRRIAIGISDLPPSLADWKAIAIVAYSLRGDRVAAAWRIDRESGQIDSDLDELDCTSLKADLIYTAEIDEWQSVLLGFQSLANAVRRRNILHVVQDHEDASSPAVSSIGFTERVALPVLAHVLGLTKN